MKGRDLNLKKQGKYMISQCVEEEAQRPPNP